MIPRGMDDKLISAQELGMRLFKERVPRFDAAEIITRLEFRFAWWPVRTEDGWRFAQTYQLMETRHLLTGERSRRRLGSYLRWFSRSWSTAAAIRGDGLVFMRLEAGPAVAAAHIAPYSSSATLSSLDERRARRRSDTEAGPGG